VVLTKKSTNSRLDLEPWVGQRQSTFKFDLIDGITLEPRGEIFPIRDTTPTLSHDTSRTTKRTVSSFTLDPIDTAKINPYRDRVIITMLMGNDEYPLGRYAFSDQTSVVTTMGKFSTCSLVDEMFVIDQKTEDAFSPILLKRGDAIATVTTVEDAIARLLVDYPVTLSIESSSFYSVGSWPQGTNRGRIIDDMSLDGDYFPMWFNNNGILRGLRSFNPSDQIPDFDWDTHKIVIADSISEINDLINAPNRIIVISNGSSNTSLATAPVVGMYDIPASAPNSIFNTGIVVPDVRELQVDTVSQATALAKNIAQRDIVVERVELSTAPDPRHDGYDVIYWQGVKWLETAWSLPLVEGGEMRHSLRRTYSDAA
jgi:hypothetical protein